MKLLTCTLARENILTPSALGSLHLGVMVTTSAPVHERSKAKPWLEWLSLGLITLIAVVTIIGAFSLQRHATDRREVMRQLEQLSTMTTDLSRLRWQALAEIEPQGGFSRLRGEEQMSRGTVYEHLAALYELEERGQWLNGRLGFTGTLDSLEGLEGQTQSFLASVQGTFGQMAITPASQLRDRLKRGDPGFDYLQEETAKVSAEAAAIARRAERIAALATSLAALLTLSAATWGLVKLSRLRSQRQQDLEKERMATLQASEARFKALVQKGTDLIVVLEPGGEVRYASPASTQMLGLRPNDLKGENFFEYLNFSIDEQSSSETEVQYLNRDGEVHDLELHLSDLRHDADVKGIVVNARDISDRKALERRLRHQALHDPLTNLPNRRQLQEHLEKALTANANVAVLFIDLDGFKLVNDSFGHKAGDRLLIQVTERIRACLQPETMLVRQGGDEFIVLSEGAREDASENASLELAERILKALEPPFTLRDGDVFISASIGVVLGAEGLGADEVVQRADIAMYQAKRSGKARATLFTPDMATNAPERLKLETDFRLALERSEFEVYYQPKVNLLNNKVESLEALVRWNHPEKGLVSPDVFIPFAEETGLIGPLGKFILEAACHDAAMWQRHDVVIAVNLSPLQFRNPNLVTEVRDALTSSGLKPEKLELEITESAVLGDVVATNEVLEELKALGVRLAIDDFGTGYSNLSHLKDFKVDVLKIDQSFVRGKPPGSDALSDGAIVEAVISMAKAFGLHVVAEGVETHQHAEQLRDLGCDLGQGYYFSKPVTSGEITSLLQDE